MKDWSSINVRSEENNFLVATWSSMPPQRCFTGEWCAILFLDPQSCNSSEDSPCKSMGCFFLASRLWEQKNVFTRSYLTSAWRVSSSFSKLFLPICVHYVVLLLNCHLGQAFLARVASANIAFLACWHHANYPIGHAKHSRPIYHDVAIECYSYLC